MRSGVLWCGLEIRSPAHRRARPSAIIMSESCGTLGRVIIMGPVVAISAASFEREETERPAPDSSRPSCQGQRSSPSSIISLRSTGVCPRAAARCWPPSSSTVGRRGHMTFDPCLAPAPCHSVPSARESSPDLAAQGRSLPPRDRLPRAHSPSAHAVVGRPSQPDLAAVGERQRCSVPRCTGPPAYHPGSVVPPSGLRPHPGPVTIARSGESRVETPIERPRVA